MPLHSHGRPKLPLFVRGATRRFVSMRPAFMRRLLTRAALGALLSSGVFSAARAQWVVQTPAPNAFGNLAGAASVSSADGDRLVVQCVQRGAIRLAYVVQITMKDLDPKNSAGIRPVTLLIKAGQGSVMKFDGAIEDWDNGYGAYVASGRTVAFLDAIKAMGAAISTISVGAIFPGIQSSDEFSAAGVARAMAGMMKTCHLADIPAPNETGNERGAPSGASPSAPIARR